MMCPPILPAPPTCPSHLPYPPASPLQALHPFYVFEVVTVAFWMADAYYYYSGCILLIQAISITISMVQTRRVSKGRGRAGQGVG